MTRSLLRDHGHRVATYRTIASVVLWFAIASATFALPRRRCAIAGVHDRLHPTKVRGLVVASEAHPPGLSPRSTATEN
jgi:hypothetical protein